MQNCPLCDLTCVAVWCVNTHTKHIIYRVYMVSEHIYKAHNQQIVYLG